MIDKIRELLGSDADSLLNYKAKFPKDQLNLPGPDFVDRIVAQSDRNINEKPSVDIQHGQISRNGICFNSSC
jgi:hypothetical protein